MEKIKLFEFDNVREDLKKIENEKKEMLMFLNIIEKTLVILKAVVIIVYALTFINENLTLIQSFLWIITITASITVLLLFCDGVEEKIRRIRRTLRKGK
ncbi:hypothetical protein [Streptobacillus moniliformis]|uniref:hypothetical protein n=2 Tax=Streptobacillus moniliformis TaxID=34105 RepID=UPI0007E37048|nr:hypothetical protein [Streptobacillus moniliformis]